VTFQWEFVYFEFETNRFELAMNDFIKSIRRTYQLLLIVTLVLFFYSIESDNILPYKKAANEIELLRTINYRSYMNYVNQVIKKDLRNYSLNVKDSLQVYVNELDHINIADDFIFESTIALAWPDHAKNSISEIRDFFYKKNSVSYFREPKRLEDIKESIQFFKYHVEDTKIEYQKGFSTVNYPDEVFVKYVKLIMDSSNVFQYNNSEFSIFRDNLENSDIINPTNHKYWVTDAKGQGIGYDPFELDDTGAANTWLSISRIKASYAEGWLCEEVPQLCSEDMTTDLYPVLPYISNILFEIQDLSLEEARAYVQAKIKKTEKNVTILGISIKEEILLLVGPGMIFVIIFYLLVQVKNMLFFFQESKLHEISFPWIGAVPNLLSRFVLLTTLVFFPSFTAFRILFRYGVWDTIGIVLPIILATGILITGVVVLNRLYVFQKRLSRE
jgi:hypothetical protein